MAEYAYENKNKNNTCTLCPRGCNLSAHAFCGRDEGMRVAKSMLHFWEEPCISGRAGSGAVFFGGCNLKCIFCQNAAISGGGEGKPVSTEELCDIFYELKEKDANNINLVTATHFVPQLREAIIMAKDRGFDLPFVYNTSAYESVDTIRSLDGLIDIYLPDFKFMDEEKARKYSHAADYPAVAKAAIEEMVRQTGEPEFFREGSVLPDESTVYGGTAESSSKKLPDDAPALMKKGVIVRHLVMPLGVKNAIAVLDYLYDTYHERIFLSVMNQYTPLYDVPGALSEEQKKRLDNFPELKRKITKREYEKVLNHLYERGMENVFIQEEDASGEGFIPDF